MFYVFHIPPSVFFSTCKQIYCMKILFSSVLSSLFPVTTIGLLLVGFFYIQVEALTKPLYILCEWHYHAIVCFKSSNLGYIWILGIFFQPFKDGLSPLSDD